MSELRKRFLLSSILLFSSASLLQAEQLSAGTVKPSSVCPSATFVTIEGTQIASVDWVQYSPDRTHSISVLNQAVTVDELLEMRRDATAKHTSVEITVVGETGTKHQDHDFGQDEVPWADFVASSIADAVLRARYLNKEVVLIPTHAPFEDLSGTIEVRRIDSTDWTVSYHNKRYLVLTDDRGCMLAATLPEHGVVIESQPSFKRGDYPLWAPYGAPPDKIYSAKEVRIQAPQGHTLVGTLTLPNGFGRFPAAVLITGLGKNNRNNGPPPYMPFRDMADSLSKAGIAVMRVDDRGVGASSGDRVPSTTYDEADDVRTEIAWLKLRPDIDAKRIALVGYSEGGLIAPMVASTDRTIAAIVTVAGPGTPGDQLAREQTENAVSHNPAISPANREGEVAKELAEPMTVREQVVLTIDPMSYASRVKCPALVLQGGSDITVPIRSAERIGFAMRNAGNRDVTVQVFPGISHSLIPDPVGDNDSRWRWLPAFRTSPILLQTMTNWLEQRLR